MLYVQAMHRPIPETLRSNLFDLTDTLGLEGMLAKSKEED